MKQMVPQSPFSPWFDRDMFAWEENSLANMPSVDMHEDNKNIIVKADMPGLDKKNIEVKVQDGRLVLKGSSSTEKTKEDKKKKFYHQERSSTSLYREIVLPKSVDANKVKAELKDGVLTVTLPKLNGKTEKAIKVE